MLSQDEDPKLFWYLSSATDFYPVKAFADQVNLFVYSDFFEGYQDNHFIQLALNLDKNLEIISSGSLFLPGSDDLVHFFYGAYYHESEKYEFYLLFFNADNKAVADWLNFENAKADYICSVGDGCEALNPDERKPCVMLEPAFRNCLKPDGFWLADHCPEQVKHRFIPIRQITGWGRYNLNECTTIYRIED